MLFHHRIITAILILAGGPSAAGCSVLSDVDRTQIDAGAGADGGGGNGGNGGSAGMGGAAGQGGGAPECANAGECPAPANECALTTCTNGICGFDFIPAGTNIAAQTPADCLRAVCDGAGMITSEFDDTDTAADDGMDCTVQGCSMGMPTSALVSAGTNCDDNGGQICNALGECVAIACGDGIPSGTEGCDDGNPIDDDGCDSNCTPTGCGNGILTSGEDCDDSNLIDNDGCDSDCSFTLCGNGIMNMGEVCDDGNLISGDGCDANCTVTACGNGVATMGEVCDDSNIVDGDGCTSLCQQEANYQCMSSPPPGLCFLFETSCDNGLDDDGDGLSDLLDNDCAQAANLDPCAAGEFLYVFSSLDVPTIVPDMAAVQSNVVVSSGGTVQRAVVTLSISHPFDADLDISIESPQGMMVALSNDNGEGGANYTSTIFDDICQTSIIDGITPFTGCYSPQETLANFNGTNPNGTWKLHVADDAIFDGGVLTSWSVALCIAP